MSNVTVGPVDPAPRGITHCVPSPEPALSKAKGLERVRACPEQSEGVRVNHQSREARDWACPVEGDQKGCPYTNQIRGQGTGALTSVTCILSESRASLLSHGYVASASLCLKS